MRNYADYEYYANKYQGSSNATLFNSLIYEASRIIDNNVNKKIQENDITEEVKYVACKLVDYLIKEKNTNNALQSVSIDGVSKTYKSNSKEEMEKEKQSILNYLPHELTRYL